MGRKKKSVLGRENLIKEVQESQRDSKEPQECSQQNVEVSKKNPALESCSIIDKLQKLSIDEESVEAISGITDELEVLTIDEGNEPCENTSNAKVPQPDDGKPVEHFQVHTFIVYQFILPKIPAFAHPSVSEHIKAKFQSFLGNYHFSTEVLLKHLSTISEKEIRDQLKILSNKAKMSCQNFLMPPIHKCLLVISWKKDKAFC